MCMYSCDLCVCVRCEICTSPRPFGPPATGNETLTGTGRKELSSVLPITPGESREREKEKKITEIRRENHDGDNTLGRLCALP